MDGFNRLIVAGVFALVLAIAVGIGSFLLVSKQRQYADMELELASLREAERQAAQKSVRVSPRLRTGVRSVNSDGDRVKSLQDLLRQKDKLLSEQKAVMTQLATEKKTLSKDIDKHLEMIVRMADAQERKTNSEGKTFKEEIEQLRLELLEAEAGDTELNEQLTQLRDQLSKTEEELESLQLDSEVQRSATELVQQSSNEVLKELGAEAVPPLIKMLDHKSDTVRIWAANTLGEIGLAAEDAADALTILTKDTSQDVQQAARQALGRILP